MNKIANTCFSDIDFANAVSDIANKQFARRRGAYSTISIFDREDLEQELWCELFESACIDKGDLLRCAEKKAESLAQKGIRKRGDFKAIEIPISQLEKGERRYVENLLYSTVSESD